MPHCLWQSPSLVLHRQSAEANELCLREKQEQSAEANELCVGGKTLSFLHGETTRPQLFDFPCLTICFFLLFQKQFFFCFTFFFNEKLMTAFQFTANILSCQENNNNNKSNTQWSASFLPNDCSQHKASNQPTTTTTTTSPIKPNLDCPMNN